MGIVTKTRITQMSDPADKVQTGEARGKEMTITDSPEAALSLPNKARRIVAISITAIVVSGAGLAWAQIHHAGNVARDERISAVQTDAATQQGDLDTRVSQELDALNAALALAQTALADSEGQVDDDAARQALSTQIESAILVADLSPGTPEVSTTTVDGVDVSFVDANFISTCPAATTLLQDATSAVETARTTWVTARLSEAIANGQNVLGASEGKVTNAALRDELAATLTAAQDPQASTVVSDALAARDSVDVAAAAVVADQAVWQTAEDARLAEEARLAEVARQAEIARQEAAAAAPAASSSTRSSGNGRTSSAGGAPASTGGGGSSATSSSPSANGAGPAVPPASNGAGPAAPPASSGNGSGGTTGGSSSGGGATTPAEPAWGPSIVQATLPGVPSGYTCKSSPNTSISGDKGTNFAAWAASVGNPAKFVATGNSSLVTVSAYFCYAN